MTATELVIKNAVTIWAICGAVGIVLGVILVFI